jgi:hypothetical protein
LNYKFNFYVCAFAIATLDGERNTADDGADNRCCDDPDHYIAVNGMYVVTPSGVTLSAKHKCLKALLQTKDFTTYSTFGRKSSGE